MVKEDLKRIAKCIAKYSRKGMEVEPKIDILTIPCLSFKYSRLDVAREVLWVGRPLSSSTFFSIGFWN